MVHICKMMISPGVFFHFFKVFILWAVKEGGGGRWGKGGLKGQKIAQNEKNNYICHVPYLRNSAGYDHDFWYTYVNSWYLHGVFLKNFLILIFWAVISWNFFQFFKILFFWLMVVKITKLQKISQEPYSIWLSFMIKW